MCVECTQHAVHASHATLCVQNSVPVFGCADNVICGIQDGPFLERFWSNTKLMVLHGYVVPAVLQLGFQFVLHHSMQLNSLGRKLVVGHDSTATTGDLVLLVVCVMVCALISAQVCCGETDQTQA